jgi:hypothetical protein
MGLSAHPPHAGSSQRCRDRLAAWERQALGPNATGRQWGEPSGDATGARWGTCGFSEATAAAESASFNKGMNSLLTAAGYYTTVMLKANMTLTAEETTVSVGDGIAASRELSKLLAQGDDEAKWAKLHATQARIIEVMRSLPAEQQEMVLARLDGRPWPPPTGGRRALVESDRVTGDDEGDPFDADDDDFDDDD